MGSRIMHLAIASGLLNELPGVDQNRFLLGSLLPDAATDRLSHRTISVFDGAKKTYDLTGFRGQFHEQLKSDPLYLGYYLHLVQDLIFRQFVYTTYRWDPRPAGNVERLHRDYAILNPYLIEKYSLSCEIQAPRLLEQEPLLQDCAYDVERLLLELRADFADQTDGEIFFFQREMADAYISQTVPVCRTELNAIHLGKGFLDEIALAWNRQ